MNVRLITGITSFPSGTATAKRIILLGKSFLESGINYSVYSNGIQYNEFNKEVKGEYENISFEYLHGKIIRKDFSTIKKIVFYIFGCINLIGVFLKFKKNEDVVYSYNHGNLFNVYIIFLCKLFKIKLIQEINEWYHDEPNRKLEKFIMEKVVVEYSDGAVIISSPIERKVKMLNEGLKLIKIPILEDFKEMKLAKYDSNQNEKYCFWMGDVDCYIKDIEIILKACSILHNDNVQIKFYASGPYSAESLEKIMELITNLKLPKSNFELLGFISEEDLKQYCNNAFLFVVPLWDNVRSKSRFPTKIASFIQNGKPIISCKVGEVADFFENNKSILFYEVGDSKDLAKRMLALINDQELYLKIVENSYNVASTKFNFKTYSNPLKFFAQNL